MNNNHTKVQKIIAKALLSQRVENDHLLIDDTHLQNIVNNTTTLTVEEKQLLLGSPITMKRLRFLDIAHRKQLSAEDIRQAYRPTMITDIDGDVSVDLDRYAGDIHWLRYACNASIQGQPHDALLTNLPTLEATNDASFAILQAAAGNSDAFTIETQDLRFTIHFLAPMRGQYRFMVCSNEQWFTSLFRSIQALCLTTQEGTIIVEDSPDECGQVSGIWALDASPREYLSQKGSALQITVLWEE